MQLRRSLSTHPETKTTFVDVVSCDTVPDKAPTKRPAAIIANLSASDNAGTHWIAFYFNPEPPHEYFDSYGLVVPSKYGFQKLLAANGGQHYKRNCNTLQSPLSTVCGQYCMHFILMRCRGDSMENIVAEFDPDDPMNNDIRVNKSVKKNFGLKLNIFDLRFLLPRITPLIYTNYTTSLY
jgi:hypothetical protein